MLGTMALLPKTTFLFIVREYVEPLGNGERLLLLATVLASLVSATGVQSHLAGAYDQRIGWAGAATLEIVYLGAALANTSARHRSAWQRLGVWLVLLVAALAAIAFNLAHQIERRGGFSWFFVIEAVVFPLVALLCALISHGLAGDRLGEQRQQEDAERQRQRQQEDDLRALQMDYRKQQAALDLARVQAENEEKLRALRRDLRKGSVQGGAQMHTDARVHSASDSGKAADRDAHKAAILHAVQHRPDVQKTVLAMELGISRRQVYVLIDELKQEGKL